MRCYVASLCILPGFNTSCLLLATSAAAQTYKLIDLGGFSGDDRSTANSIHDAGVCTQSSTASTSGRT